ncbi:hypothetical protein JB92DRAFT_3055498 [Gautieria morchelliformis]|nr:hypothetical protein JB92DRAFT_3055498 [Gautieria morchelliformis]
MTRPSGAAIGRMGILRAARMCNDHAAWLSYHIFLDPWVPLAPATRQMGQSEARH